MPGTGPVAGDIGAKDQKTHAVTDLRPSEETQGTRKARVSSGSLVGFGGDEVRGTGHSGGAAGYFLRDGKEALVRRPFSPREGTGTGARKRAPVKLEKNQQKVMPWKPGDKNQDGRSDLPGDEVEALIAGSPQW